MKIAICDDCMEDALLLKRFLEEHEVKIYTDAGSFLADIKNNNFHYDLYLLDIFIKESINGIELAKELRKVHDEAIICFISTSDDFYRDAYDLYALQYLIKPVQEEEMGKLLSKVSKSLAKNREQKLSFQSRGQSGSIAYGNILYIGSREHTLSICCTDGTVWECRGRLNEMAMRVCGDVFMRCHQSFIVNMYHVDSLSAAGLMIRGQHIPISRRYYADVKKRYQEILFEEVN